LEDGEIDAQTKILLVYLTSPSLHYSLHQANEMISAAQVNDMGLGSIHVHLITKVLATNTQLFKIEQTGTPKDH
jgi:hypothetical protein